MVGHPLSLCCSDVCSYSFRHFWHHRKDWPKSEPTGTGWGAASKLLNISLPDDVVLPVTTP